MPKSGTACGGQLFPPSNAADATRKKMKPSTANDFDLGRSDGWITCKKIVTFSEEQPSELEVCFAAYNKAKYGEDLNQ